MPTLNSNGKADQFLISIFFKAAFASTRSQNPLLPLVSLSNGQLGRAGELQSGNNGEEEGEKEHI